MENKYNTLVIIGKSDSGKTTVIKYIKNKFDNKSPKQDDDDDIILTVTYENKKIGIISGGDTRAYLEKAYKSIEVCDYYIGAAHLYGDTIDFYLDERNAANGKHKFNRDNVIFLKNIKGKDDKTKVDKKEASKPNEKFAKMAYDIFMKVMFENKDK